MPASYYSRPDHWWFRVRVISALVTIVVASLGQVHQVVAHPGTEAPDSTITLQMPFIAGEVWTVGGAGYFYGEGTHSNANNDYYATDWNRAGDLGAAVLPVADGTVTAVRDQPCPITSFGCYVQVDHGDGYRTLYGHLDDVMNGVANNTKVRTSTLLGRVGNTGNSQGAHLHLRFHRNGSSYCFNQGNVCPNNEVAQYPQGYKPSPMQTGAGASGLIDGGTYKSVNGRVYVPYLRNDGWTSIFHVRNNGTETRSVNIYYYNTGGTPTPKVSDTCGLSSNQACTISVADLNRIPAGTIGSAYVDGGEDISVMVTSIRSASPTVQGAYDGVLSTRTSNSYYIPLAIRQRQTASGLSNSEVTVQNTTTAAMSVQIHMIVGAGSPGTSFTKSVTIPANGSYRYKLKDEVPGNLADGWIGSIVVTGSRVSVTSDFFSWAEETVFTTNGFPASAKWDRWFVPLFFVRRNTLTGVMSTPVSVQNVSNNNATIHVNEVALICKAAQGSGYNDFTVYNPVVISPNATYSFNPVTHTTLFPTDGWYGSCRVEVVGGKQAVVLPQVRFPATRNAAFYEGIQGNGDHTRLIFPVVQKRLADGSATSLVIHNLSLTNSANVSLYYYGDDNSTECTNTSPINGGAPLLFTIAPGASLARNHRLLNSGSPEEETAMPVGWCGNLVVTSSEPVDGMLQLSNITNPPGDTFMAGMADAR